MLFVPHMIWVISYESYNMSQISIPNGLIRCSIKFCIALPFPFHGLFMISYHRFENRDIWPESFGRSTGEKTLFKGSWRGTGERTYLTFSGSKRLQASPLHLSEDIKLFNFSSRFKLSSTVESGLIVKYTIENIPERIFSFGKLGTIFCVRKWFMCFLLNISEWANLASILAIRSSVCIAFFFYFLFKLCLALIIILQGLNNWLVPKIKQKINKRTS